MTERQRFRGPERQRDRTEQDKQDRQDRQDREDRQDTLDRQDGHVVTGQTGQLGQAGQTGQIQPRVHEAQVLCHWPPRNSGNGEANAVQAMVDDRAERESNTMVLG